jgi:hypothetical protein
VEISQYFHLAQLLNVANNRVISIILGGAFDWMDILCYGVGCFIIGSVSFFYNRYLRSLT